MITYIWAIEESTKGWKVQKYSFNTDTSEKILLSTVDGFDTHILAERYCRNRGFTPMCK